MKRPSQLIALLLASATPAALAAAKPNIIFILADDLGWTDVSTGAGNHGNGSRFYETPHIDLLAKGGMAFSSAYMQPNCAPTRAALISGQYPARSGNGVYNVNSLNRGKKNGLVPPNQNEDVPAASTTIAEVFQQAGYTTAHFGKYHAGGHEGGAATLPKSAGFDFNVTGAKEGHPASYHAKKKNGRWKFPKNLSPDLDGYAKPYDKSYIKKHQLPATLIGKPKHLSDALADSFESFLSEHVKKPSHQPFYVQYWLYAVHTPIHPRPDLANKYQQKKGSSKADGCHSNSKYAALVESMDQSVGRIIAALDDPNGDGDTSDSITQNTLVIFTSDNGGHRGATSNAPLRRAKGTFYEGGIRVPLIAYQPGTIPAGSRSDTMVHAVDYYPTFIEAAGIKKPTSYPLDGESFASLLSQPESIRDRQPITYHFPGYMDDRAQPSSTIIAEIKGQRYKLIHYYETGTNEVYNLSKDIGEKNNLALTPENQQLQQALLKLLSQWLTQKTPGWQPAFPKDRQSGKTLIAPSIN